MIKTTTRFAPVELGKFNWERVQSSNGEQQLTDTWFDKFMNTATQLLLPLWMPLVVGSLIAIAAKKIVPFTPIPNDAKNFIMRVSGYVRNAAVTLVLFFFVMLFWSLNKASRDAQAVIDQTAIDRALAQ